MPRNLIVRVGLDASGYHSGLAKMPKAAETVSKKVSKALSQYDISQNVGKAMGWSGKVSDAVTQVNSTNVAQARQQLADLTAYKQQMESIGFDANSTDPQYGAVSERIRELTYDIKAYEDELQRQVAAQQQAAQSAQDASQQTVSAAHQAASAKREETEANEESNSAMRRSIHPLRSLGQRLRSIGSHVPGIRKTSDEVKKIGKHSKSSSLDVCRMVNSLRRVALVSFAFRIAGTAMGRLRSIVSEYISENETLQAQVNGLRAGMGQALAPAINLVVNAMSALLPYVLGVSNAIGQLMGALFGEGWTAAANGAKKTAAATGSAAKAQKELNRQLMSFDEINKLNDNSSSDSGGGGSAADNNITPISSKMPAWMERFKTSFSELFNSEEFKAANIGGKIGMALQTGLDWLGNEGKAFDWRGVGTKLRENFDSFMASGWVDSMSRFAGIMVSGLADAVIGFLSPEWKALKKHYEEEGLLGAAAYAGSLIGGIPAKLTEAVYSHIFSPFFGGMSEYLMEKGHNSAADFFDGLSQGSNEVGKTMGENITNTLLSSIGLKWPTVRTNIKSYLNILAEAFRRSGNESAAGFFQGLADKFSKSKKTIKDEFTDPVVDTVNTEFGIHSPSTVFAGIASLCMTGYGNGLSDGFPGVLDKLNDLKEKIFSISDKIRDAFSFEWHMPTLKLPHLNVEWDPVDNVLANFFGVTAFPRLSVSWFAKGGILNGAQIFGRMGSTLLGGGEAGREAVLPLESNTGWMDKIADRVVSRLADQNGGDINATIYLMLDGDILDKRVIKVLRKYARANGGLSFN